MSGHGKEDRGFLHFVAGASVVIRLMLLALAVVLLIFIGRCAYTAGYVLFQEETGSEQEESGSPADLLSEVLSRLKGTPAS